MNDLSDREIEDLLTRHLGTCLDGQLGRAAAAFSREAPRRPRRWHRGRIVLWLSGAATMAAGFTIAWFMTHPRTPNHPVGPDAPLAVVTEDVVPPMLQSVTWSKVMDDGLRVIDDRPVRRLRRKMVEEVEWYDSSCNAVVKTTQPRQQVFLVDMKTD
jgi:hypothetical protein